MNERASRIDRVTPYQFFMLALCLWALASLGAGTVLRLRPSTLTILAYADTVVCGLFFIDFVISFYRAPSRWTYFRTWGWIDLLSSIPAVDALRLGRAVRVMRILRVIRAMKSARA